MKLILENWRKYLNEVELWGNCGMVAIALAEEAQNRGLEPKLVLVHDADDDNTILYGDYSLYHVAVIIGNKYYDDRGEISREDLNFDDFGEEDKDYFVDEFPLGEKIERAIARNTNWDACPADFRERANKILDNYLEIIDETPN